MELVNLKTKIPSVNNKYCYNPKIGRLFLSKKYRDFKTLIENECIDVKLKPPYSVTIYYSMYLDIDNPLKATLDGIREVLSDDKDILELHVLKTPTKRGSIGSVIIDVESLAN